MNSFVVKLGKLAYSRRGRHQIASAVAALFAMLPGFIFPFVLPLAIGQSDADTYLVAFGVSLTLWNVVVNNLELNTVSEVGRLFSDSSDSIVDRGVLRVYFRKSLAFSGKVTVAFGTLLVVIYCLARSDFESLFVAGILALFIPLIGSVSSVYSGILISTGRSSVAVGTQGVRGIAGLLSIIPATYVGIWFISVGFVFGELLRASFLARFCQVSIGVSNKYVVLGTSGLAWQSSATATAQSSPLIDRLFLGFGGAGSIVAYEIADKILFSVVQFLNLSILIRVVGNWSRLGKLGFSEARASVRRGLLYILGSSVALGALTTVVLIGVLKAGYIAEAWADGVLWGAILLMSLPLVMLNSTYGRLLILLGKQRLLIRFAIFSVFMNIVFDIVFFISLGPVGIVIATVAVRFVNAACYVLYFSRYGWIALENRSVSG